MKIFDQFHDGFLDGLLIQDSTVSVFIRTEQKEPFVLEVHGMLSLKADGFRQANIIYDIVVREGAEISSADVQGLYNFKDESQAVRKLAELSQGAVLVLEINPSYGASGLILADSVELITHKTWCERQTTSMGSRLPV